VGAVNALCSCGNEEECLYLREVENLRAERETLMAENMIVENDFQEYRDKVKI
jgi:hypothetical protein